MDFNDDEMPEWIRNRINRAKAKIARNNKRQKEREEYDKLQLRIMIEERRIL
jgi:hypothetical protein